MVERVIGNDEVGSSILPSSTIKHWFYSIKLPSTSAHLLLLVQSAHSARPNGLGKKVYFSTPQVNTFEEPPSNQSLGFCQLQGAFGNESNGATQPNKINNYMASNSINRWSVVKSLFERTTRNVEDFSNGDVSSAQIMESKRYTWDCSYPLMGFLRFHNVISWSFAGKHPWGCPSTFFSLPKKNWADNHKRMVMWV